MHLKSRGSLSLELRQPVPQIMCRERELLGGKVILRTRHAQSSARKMIRDRKCLRVWAPAATATKAFSAAWDLRMTVVIHRFEPCVD
jgi:hypothetical protein